MFFKLSVLKNFVIFTGKYLCWNLLKKRLQYRCFSGNIAKFLGTPFLQNMSSGYSEKFRKTHTKVPARESLISKDTYQPCNFSKTCNLSQVLSCEFCEILQKFFIIRLLGAQYCSKNNYSGNFLSLTYSKINYIVGYFFHKVE